jgi:hypothetical protein
VTAPKHPSSKLPKVRFSSSWELYEKVYRYALKDKEEVDTDEFESVEADLITQWMLYEEKILAGICSITGLSFRKNIIDIFLVPKAGLVSKPLIVGVFTNNDSFVEVVAYQLIFELLTDNTSIPLVYEVIEDWISLLEEDLYDDEAYFVPAFAIQKALYLDILDEPERLEEIQKRAVGLFRMDEHEAWNYVNTKDYKEIINKLHDMYKRIRNNNIF